MLWVNAIISVSSCLLFCLYFGCAAHCQSQWWSHCQVSPSGLAYAKCSCTSAHICASSCVVGPLCSLKGVAQCVSLHSVHLLCGQVSRGKECEFMVFKMRVFPFFSSQIPCVFQCIWDYRQLLSSICDWLTKWGQVKSVLISRSDWTLHPFLV